MHNKLYQKLPNGYWANLARLAVFRKNKGCPHTVVYVDITRERARNDGAGFFIRPQLVR
jgi:hypothetical protein